MFDIIRITIGMAVLLGIVLAVPIFAYILGAGLALVVLFYFIKEFKKQETSNGKME